jgi:hypothetical protein
MGVYRNSNLTNKLGFCRGGLDFLRPEDHGSSLVVVVRDLWAQKSVGSREPQPDPVAFRPTAWGDEEF